MATPNVQLQSLNLRVKVNSPNSFEIPVKNVDGSLLNVSSGYTLEKFSAVAASDKNPYFDSVDLSSTGTFTFGNGKLTWALSQANTATLEALLYTLNSAIVMAISNDTGTTLTRLASGNLVLDHASADQ